LARFVSLAIGEEEDNGQPARVVDVVIKERVVPLVEIVVVLIIVGVLLWLINTYIPMAGPIKSLLNAVVVIALIVWILKVFGLWHYNYAFSRRIVTD
jgi:hypothetical protein